MWRLFVCCGFTQIMLWLIINPAPLLSVCSHLYNLLHWTEVKVQLCLFSFFYRRSFVFFKVLIMSLLYLQCSRLVKNRNHCFSLTGVLENPLFQSLCKTLHLSCYLFKAPQFKHLNPLDWPEVWRPVVSRPWCLRPKPLMCWELVKEILTW